MDYAYQYKPAKLDDNYRYNLGSATYVGIQRPIDFAMVVDDFYQMGIEGPKEHCRLG